MDIDAWVWWLIGAVGLGIPLVLTAMPEFGMFAVGAVAAAVVAALGGGIVAQVLVFVVVSVALIAVVRPIAARHRADRPRLATGIDALKGRQAVVLERVDGNGGRIKLVSEVWSARAYDGEQSFEPEAGTWMSWTSTGPRPWSCDRTAHTADRGLPDSMSIIMRSGPHEIRPRSSRSVGNRRARGTRCNRSSSS